VSGAGVQPQLPRFVKVSSDGKLLPDTASDWAAVYDRDQDLVFSRGVIASTFTWKGAMKAAAAVELCGVSGWSAPTLMQRFRICDHSRVDPALDTNYFAEDSGWEWTSTVDASAPSGGAWFVSLGSGYSVRSDQGGRNRVRAVRAGQLFGFGSSVSA
jgi:hypothetical protein